MKITLTGSIGNINKPLVQELIEKGHDVTVISSSADRTKDIEALGAKAAIGSITDTAFLTEAFTGSDIVYLMEVLGEGAFFDPNVDVIEAITNIGRNYKEAVAKSGVKKIVHLSSIGADKPDNGMLAFHYNVEQILNELPQDVAIKFMRPVGFYYNMYMFIPQIKQHGAIFSNYGGDDREPWVSPLDIAAVIAEEMEKPFEGRTVRYIASEELSTNELVKILGEAIGKPDLQWIVVPDEQLLQGMVAAGMNPQSAKGFMEMNAKRRGGILYQDYFAHRPVLGKTKVKDFVKDFAAAYNKQ